MAAPSFSASLPMHAVSSAHGEAYFAPMQYSSLDAVQAVEQSVYAHPWARRNFEDVLRSGYQAQLLQGGDQLLGYLVAMQGFEEVHLLNMTVALPYQRQGWAHLMLDARDVWARGLGAPLLWLEVRQSNARAIEVYTRHGYRATSVRKAYYPAAAGQREDALIMCRTETD